ncbi:MAG TPA: hypothetical protein VFS32_02100 [Candidatus Limnocylindrales bacterium]|nr:hypothetical protein [Candidatus Limnocylindrales bacterium]
MARVPRPRPLVAAGPLAIAIGGAILLGSASGGRVGSRGGAAPFAPALAGAADAASVGSPFVPSPPPSPPSPRPSASTSEPSPPPYPAVSAVPPYVLDLYAAGDFVPQATDTYCVPASIATMVNLMIRGPGGRRLDQTTLYRLARRYSSDRLLGPGAEPAGMARTLDALRHGRYRVAAVPTRAAAIRLAARAIRRTHRPVALFVWRGAHAWVMSGFRATADPARTSRFAVTAVRVEDVWYPRISSIWGRSYRPDSLVPVRQLGGDYLRWQRPTVRYAELDGRYVLVVPV